MRQPNVIIVLLVLFVGLAPVPSVAATKTPHVVVSIKPLHALVAGVMRGVGSPHLLLDDQQSPHHFALKPSQARLLQQADLVFWIGPALETPLPNLLRNLAPQADAIGLLSQPGLTLHKNTVIGDLDNDRDESRHDKGHGHDDDHHNDGHDDDDHRGKDHDNDHHNDGHHDDDHKSKGHDDDHHNDGHHDDDHHDGHHDDDHQWHNRSGINPHIWLDLNNARLMVRVIAATLAKVDPDHAALYRDNADAVNARLAELGNVAAAKLAPLQNVRFIVQHDAFVYLERQFGLTPGVVIAVDHDTPPGTRHLQALRDLVESGKVSCIFCEPQGAGHQIDIVSGASTAGRATIDALGFGRPAGPDLYFDLMRVNYDAFATCLNGSGVANSN